MNLRGLLPALLMLGACRAPDPANLDRALIEGPWTTGESFDFAFEAVIHHPAAPDPTTYHRVQ